MLATVLVFGGIGVMIGAPTIGAGVWLTTIGATVACNYLASL